MIELTEGQHEELLQRLHLLRDEIRATLRVTAEHAGTVHLDQAAVGRLSRVDALQAQQMAAEQRRRSELRLKQVGTALQRSADDEYGDCLACGEPIGFRRLTARPESPLCLACSEQRGW
jgi:DnaK suppressor protein